MAYTRSWKQPGKTKKGRSYNVGLGKRRKQSKAAKKKARVKRASRC